MGSETYKGDDESKIYKDRKSKVKVNFVFTLNNKEICETPSPKLSAYRITCFFYMAIIDNFCRQNYICLILYSTLEV